MNRRQALIDAIEVLVSLVRNVRMRRALQGICTNPHLNFWRVIYGDLTDTAVLEWCKLFGADSNTNQPVHWKNVASDENKFRGDLLSHLDITRPEWDAYWEEMKTYRDRSVAHHDARRASIAAYPKFDIALKSAYFYYAFVRGELKKLGIDQQPADLKQYSDDFANQCAEVGTAALSATNQFEEKVR